MSLKALSWAAEQRCARPADKLILLGLADCHNRSHSDIYPSVMWLTEFSGLDRKTVLKAMDRLREAGLIIDTGRRIGRGVIVYRFPNESDPKNGTATPEPDRSQFSAEAVPLFPDAVPKTAPVPVPKTGHRTGKGNQERNREGTGDARASALPADFTPILTDAARAITDKWPPGMIERELAQFKDRSIAKGQTYKDWQAAFRTWIGNADKWRSERAGSGKSRTGYGSTVDAIDDWANGR